MLPALRLRRRFLFGCLILLWCAAVAWGFDKLWRYASEPGPTAESPSQWPHDSIIPPPSGRPTLLMFAHPKCPCTRASIEELAQIMTQCQGRLSAYVLFPKPAGADGDWEQTSLFTAAQAVPGVQVETDVDCREARRFAAKTSGFVLLYGGDGRLLFQGGITKSRGHSGDNPGRSAVVEWVIEGKSAMNRCGVFGCLIENDES
jgi:hypothetical protein